MENKKKTEINDLTFKELIKKGYALEENNKVWDISNYKNFFLTEKQVQAYLDLEKEEKYNKNVFSAETKLMEKSVERLLKTQEGEYYNVIDLGCCEGKKAITIIKSLLKNNNKVRYCPVDFSGYMIEKALKNVSNFDTKKELQYQWNVSDFEHIDNVIPLMRFKKHKNNIIMLLRNILGNHQINDLLYRIRSAMKENDILIIGNGLNNGEEEEIIKAYDNQKVQDFLSPIISSLGLNPKELEPKTRFIHSRIENYYTFKKQTTIKSDDQEITFEEGDKIIVSHSSKYKKQDFLGFLNIYFSQVDYEISEKGNYILAFCRK